MENYMKLMCAKLHGAARLLRSRSRIGLHLNINEPECAAESIILEKAPIENTGSVGIVER